MIILFKICENNLKKTNILKMLIIFIYNIFCYYLLLLKQTKNKKRICLLLKYIVVAPVDYFNKILENKE